MENLIKPVTRNGARGVLGLRVAPSSVQLGPFLLGMQLKIDLHIVLSVQELDRYLYAKKWKGDRTGVYEDFGWEVCLFCASNL